MPYLITPKHLAAIAGKPTRLMTGLAEWLNATIWGQLDQVL